MFTILGSDGKEYGPVSADQLRSWMAAGRANLETKAKTEGSGEWRRLGDYPEFGGSGAMPPPMAPPLPDTAARSGPVNIAAFANDLIARAAPLDVFRCIERSFELWKAHLLPLVGVTLLMIVVQMVIGFIPFIGSVANLILPGVFYGGLYYYILGRMRGEPREVGDLFIGFKKCTGPLILATLFTTLLAAAIILPFFAPWIFYFIKLAGAGGGTPPMPSAWIILVSVVGFCIAIYFSVGWAFTFQLVIDQQLSAWEAMEVSRRVVTKQWGRVFGLGLLAGLITLLGVIALFIGVFFTLPLMFGAMCYAYEDLCRPPAKTSAIP